MYCGKLRFTYVIIEIESIYSYRDLWWKIINAIYKTKNQGISLSIPMSEFPWK